MVSVKKNRHSAKRNKQVRVKLSKEEFEALVRYIQASGFDAAGHGGIGNWLKFCAQSQLVYENRKSDGVLY